MKVLVGYLATAGGADALALGVRLARTLDAQLELCMVLPPDYRVVPGVVLPGGYEQLLAEQAQEWLDEACKSVPGEIATDSHVRFDESAAEGLIKESSRLGADVVVVGGTGGGLIGRLTLGSVVNELLHSSPVPVAVAPRGLRESSVDRVREVTCALGERQGADLLLQNAVRFSRAAGSPLRLVSLVALDPVFGALRGDDDAIRQRAREHAEQILDAAKSELPEEIPVTSTVVDGTTVEDAVAKLAWRDGDVIMVGSSRLSAPRRLFLGSTAAKMLRVLEVPIVVVPRDQLGRDELP
ncbi:universal stress protein [Mycolicibacterium sp. XJ1819]